ncbi:hypothetical protein MPH_01691 [Macrophomina phaseolina MS6]|uniref:Uncharacterized protein n=1 Tax=Macrophomina phaseolina (strain MS6) TaxID=1126212 RepID=K2S7W5_MACPH|nr:hypothetical protein MPH_01691 [Macrophomina phaseolina MS6]
MDHLPTLSSTSQARLSELLNVFIQTSNALRDEFDGIMGPNGQGWGELLDNMFPGSDGSERAGGQSPNPGTTTARHTVSSTATLAPFPRTVPARGSTNQALAIPAAACPMALSNEQRTEEWRLINHYADVRARMTHDQLARTHAAFLRWWGWAPTKEEMQRAREAAKAVVLVTGLFGAWCSPFATQVWMKALRDQSIEKIRELKMTDWAKAESLAGFVGVRLKQADRPGAVGGDVSTTGPENDGAASLIVKLKVRAPDSMGLAADSRHNPASITSIQLNTTGQDVQPRDAASLATQAAGIAAPSISKTDAVDHNSAAAPPETMTISQTGDTTGSSSNNQSASAEPSMRDSIFGWVNSLTTRATSIRRSLIPTSSQDRAQSIESRMHSLPPPVLPAPLATATDSSITDNVTDDEMHESISQHGDPDSQLLQEMMMHRSMREEPKAKELIKIKQEEPENGEALASSNISSVQPLSHPEPPTAQAASKNAVLERPATKPAVKFGVRRQNLYNYHADMSSDPRINALIAYLIVIWHKHCKQNLSTNTEAMHELHSHALAAVPKVESDSRAGRTTRELFHWADREITWELTLTQINAFVKARDKQKKEAESDTPTESQQNSNERGIETTSQVTVKRPGVPAFFSSSSQATASRPQPGPSRLPYPDSSIIAISDLTPDARANSFAAYLAKKFYKAHGVDLMADADSQYKLKIFATRNEHRLKGVRELSALELNFWDEKDLKWKLTGHQLDVLKDEWVKRFPEPEDSDREDDHDDEGKHGDTDSESGDDENSHKDVDMKNSDGSDDDNPRKTPSENSFTVSNISIHSTHIDHHPSRAYSQCSSNFSAGLKRSHSAEYDDQIPAHNASATLFNEDEDFDATPLRQLKKPRLSIPSSPAVSSARDVVPSSDWLTNAMSPSQSSFSASPPRSWSKREGDGVSQNDLGDGEGFGDEQIDRNLLSFAEEYADEE